MNLRNQTEKYLEKSMAALPQETKDIMSNSAKALMIDEIGKNALKKGEKLPDFTLNNAEGKAINIYNCLAQGPLIISFYRGAWCPYCNLELAAYKEILPEIKAKGANFIAISPELPDNSLSLIEKQALEFDILTDLDNAIARDLGLVFKMNEDVRELYEKWDFKINEAQGNQNGELPLPATYVVNTDGTILLAFVDIDYTKRLEPSEAIAALPNYVKKEQ